MKTIIRFMVLYLLYFPSLFASSGNLTIFPMKNYSQNIDKWINPNASYYNTKLLDSDYQQQRYLALKNSYFGTADIDNSPWSIGHVKYVFNSQTVDKNIYDRVKSSLDSFDNSHQDERHIVYGINYRKYTQTWWWAIESNINIAQFKQLNYNKNNRAIAVVNLAMRGLPTADPAFYSHTIPGQGYPFDNISLMSVYAGTPVYIIGQSLDLQWMLVMAPEYIGWVQSSGIAKVSDEFIKTWQQTAFKNLAGITNSDISIINSINHEYQFSGYVGMIFPVVQATSTSIKVLIPEKLPSGMAGITHADIATQNATILPMSPTPQSFAKLFNALQGRPYGWGSVNFLNDCSAEMKAIYTMFGLFMPRNSKHQLEAGKVVDISSLSPKERLKYLRENGDSFFTVIHLHGHVMMYIGTYTYKDGKDVVMSYQQMWGLSPKDGSSRSVIGESVLFPLLTSYPEDTSLASELDGSIFELIYLNQFPDIAIRTGIKELMY